LREDTRDGRSKRVVEVKLQKDGNENENIYNRDSEIRGDQKREVVQSIEGTPRKSPFITGGDSVSSKKNKKRFHLPEDWWGGGGSGDNLTGTMDSAQLIKGGY